MTGIPRLSISESMGETSVPPLAWRKGSATRGSALGASGYVNLYGKRPARTIGTVRRVTATLWTAYSGLGARARRVGYAVGRDAAVGAISLMLGSFAQVRRDDMCCLKND